MVLLEFSEYHYFDDVLSDLKLTPVSHIMHKRINSSLTSQEGIFSVIFVGLLLIVCNNPIPPKQFTGKVLALYCIKQLR